MTADAIVANIGGLNLAVDAATAAPTTNDEAVTGSVANVITPDSTYWRSSNSTGDKTITFDLGSTAVELVNFMFAGWCKGGITMRCWVELFSDQAATMVIKTMPTHRVFRADNAASADESEVLQNSPHFYFGVELDSDGQLTTTSGVKAIRFNFDIPSPPGVPDYLQCRWTAFWKSNAVIQRKVSWQDVLSAGNMDGIVTVGVAGHEHIARGFSRRSLSFGVPHQTHDQMISNLNIGMSSPGGVDPLVIMPHPHSDYNKHWVAEGGAWRLDSMVRNTPIPFALDSDGLMAWGSIFNLREYL